MDRKLYIFYNLFQGAFSEVEERKPKPVMCKNPKVLNQIIHFLKPVFYRPNKEAQSRRVAQQQPAGKWANRGCGNSAPQSPWKKLCWRIKEKLIEIMNC